MVVKLYSCSTRLSMALQMLIKIEMLKKNKDILAFKFAYVVFIMPFMSMINFMIS